VGVEGGDDVDDALAVGRLDPMELGRAQPATGRVDIDATERTHPGFLLEQ
jgi:hypothetical protein